MAIKFFDNCYKIFFPGLDAEYSRAAADLLLNCLNELADVLDSIKVIPGIFRIFGSFVYLICCFP